MSSDNSTMEPIDSTDKDYYFDDIPEALQEIAYLRERYATAAANLEGIHDQLKEIDCDIGSANAAFDGATLCASMSVPTLSGTPDTVIKSYDWETIDVSFDADTELYSVELSGEYPLFGRVLNIDCTPEN